MGPSKCSLTRDMDENNTGRQGETASPQRWHLNSRLNDEHLGVTVPQRGPADTGPWGGGGFTQSSKQGQWRERAREEL